MPDYLSRIRINPHRAAARRLLTDPTQLKAAVYGGMPTQPVTRRVLWRLDGDNVHQPVLYVVSPERPSFEHLVEQAGWPGAESPQVETADYTSFLARLREGERFGFRLTANPTYVTTIVDPKHGAKKVRAAHKTVEHQTRWLTERAEGAGLRIEPANRAASPDNEVLDLLVAGRRRQRFRRGAGHVTIDMVTFVGHLTVEDVDRLRVVLTEGLGRAKGYGCGMFTLAPAARPAHGVA